MLLGINKDDGSETVMEEALAEAPKVMASKVARRDQELKVRLLYTHQRLTNARLLVEFLRASTPLGSIVVSCFVSVAIGSPAKQSYMYISQR